MKKLIRIFLVCILGITAFPVLPVHADEDYSDTEYWNSLCASTTSLSSEADKTACEGYREYIASQSEDVQAQLDAIKTEQANTEATIEELTAEIKNYQTQIDAKTAEIADTQSKIDALEVQIENKQAEIDTIQKDVDTIEDKVKERMVSAQPTMRNNKYLDLLMGASSLEELLRIASGLSSISEYDNETMKDLQENIDKLNTAKAELESAQDSLEETKAQQETEQGELVVLMAQSQAAEEAAEAKAVELANQQREAESTISNLSDIVDMISTNLNQVIPSSGWTNPVPGAHKSRGLIAVYGSSHLGVDLAASLGTTIVAAGNGIVFNRADGCGYGYLGNMCGWDQGGLYGGGNQVFLFVVVNDGLYAVEYAHMLAGTPIATGTIVKAGDYIGQIGSSGNSTGPHCHIEVFYLGSAENYEYYVQHWNGDMGFSCGWGDTGLSRLCENGVSAPCRMRPESLFGY